MMPFHDQGTYSIERTTLILFQGTTRAILKITRLEPLTNRVGRAIFGKESYTAEFMYLCNFEGRCAQDGTLMIF